MGGTSDRPAHRVFWPGPLPREGSRAEVTGDEAHHALAVKRVSAGEGVALHDGVGGIALGRVLGEPAGGRLRRLLVLIETVIAAPASGVRVEAWTAAPKGDRAADMVDQLSQVGAAAWRPLACERSVVDPRPHKVERLRRAAVESMKQCGRAWVMEVGETVTLPEAIADAAVQGADVVVADVAGEAFALRPNASCIRVLVGPEGGFTDRERAMLLDGGARACRFGPHVMRIETAAVASCAVIMAAHTHGAA